MVVGGGGVVSGASVMSDIAAAAKSLQSCPTLRDPIDSSPPGSSVHGIFQARVLECSIIILVKIFNKSSSYYINSIYI